ncbi:alpha/beta fold hydrolase [Nocardia higoensis]|uniref:Alpha/beta fold hydrolase n=1 Tax=Nocardia higoensis TaxID=228599 RepID=A0ABS0DAF9_9NOCA|nr:alpha/beta fold hydrolase [Nocardia higoensis]MBF6354813.1 alpha/beta fold hydrolase [Nocardia higoensis]
MRHGYLIAALAAVLFAVTACSSGSEGPEPVGGDWHGAIEVPGSPIEIGVTFNGPDSATIDIPVQGIEDVALRDVRTAPGDVGFVVPDIPGEPTFKGALDEATGRIGGEFTQMGQSFPLTLEPGAIAPLARPQEPRPPFPYRVEDVDFAAGDLTVAGTVTLPEGQGPFPAVVLITGSGPQNRDEELFGHKPFLLIADTLTRAGYAVLRTDDRGVGGTGGDLNTASYDDLARDVESGIDYLRGRPDIDPARIGLFGHSEGGYLAPLVAARPDSGVAFAVLMAGPSVDGGSVLIEQTRAIMAASGSTAEEIDKQLATTTEMLSLLLAGDLEGARAVYDRSLADMPEQARESAVEAVNPITPYYASFVTYDPAPALSALRIPVLALYGGKDLQVLTSQNERPARDLLAANPAATVHVFPEANHLMQPATTGSLEEYAAIETTIDPQVLTYVTDWLTGRVPPK